MFHLTFLGTSAGIPTKYRNVTALAVECVNPYLSGDKKNSKYARPWLLIDCGEATQHQLLKTKLSGHQLAAICITHVHGDHCYGLPGLLASLAMSGRRAKLIIIAPKAIATFLESLKLNTELYVSYPIEFLPIEDILSGQLVHENVKDGQVYLDFGGLHQLTIEVIPLSHRVPSHAFVMTQSVSSNRLDTQRLREAGVKAGRTWGQLQRGEDVTLQDGQILMSADYVQSVTLSTKIIVAGDNDNPSLLADASSEATVLVHEATYTDEVLEKILAKANDNFQMAHRSHASNTLRANAMDPMHSSAGQVARFAEAVKLPNLILTHFSARYQPYDDETSTTANMSAIRLEVQRYYQGHCWLAKDFAQFEVGEKVVAIKPHE